MKIFVVCPSRCATGGTELLHQYCYALTNNGVENYMVYLGDSVMPTPERFLKYSVSYVSEYVDDYDSVLVLPETQIHNIDMCQKGLVMIWWLSVNNYIDVYSIREDCSDLFKLKERKNVINFVQSEYAKTYLSEKLGIFESYYLQDYINDEIIQTSLNNPILNERENYVLYNPKKGYENIVEIIERCRKDIKWVPIVNMSPIEIAGLMLKSKVYIDFGSHPGKDRIPREAAMCGCCIITNKEGSAGFYNDVPIPEEYKCDDMSNIESALSMVYDLIDNYHDRYLMYDEYRDRILREKQQFTDQVQEAMDHISNKIDNLYTNVKCECPQNLIDSLEKITEHMYMLIKEVSKENPQNRLNIITLMLQVDFLANLIEESAYSVINKVQEESELCCSQCSED